MKDYRLIARQNRRVAGYFGINGTAALEDIRVARSMFGITGGYDCELLMTGSEQRMLGNGPEETRILMHEACYRPVTSQIQHRVAAYMPYPAYVTEFVIGRISVVPSGRVLITIR